MKRQQLTFRFNSILESRGMKYVLMNLPAEKLAGSNRHPARHAQPDDPAAGAGGMVFDTRRDQRMPSSGNASNGSRRSAPKDILVLTLENMIR